MSIRRALLSALMITTFLSPAYADTISADIQTRSISNFQVGSDETRFGAFEFIAGLEITSNNNLVGAMSGFRFSENRENFIGVADTGFWFKGTLDRDEEGIPVGIKSFELAPIRDQNGNSSGRKWQFDAEGIALRGDMVFVSFERNARIDGYPLDGLFTAAAMQTVPVQIPSREFRQNGGLEALAIAPKNSPLNGAMVALSERSVDKDGNLFASIADGPGRGVFKVKRDPPFNVTDADFLPNGDLLILERRFNIASGVGMRIRKIAGADIKKGAVVDGQVLLEAGAGFQIDNMEGMSITTDDQGQIFVTLISDDNHSFLQRNLLLEFKLLE